MSDNLSDFNKIFDEDEIVADNPQYVNDNLRYVANNLQYVADNLQYIGDDLQQLSKKHNISYARLMLSYLSGLRHGLTHECIIVGLRFSCSRSSGIIEYFTKEDIAILLDCSPDEAERQMIDSGNALKITWI